MKNYVVSVIDNKVLFSFKSGEADLSLTEFLEDRFEEKYDFRPMLQESEDDGLEVYLHTDSYEILSEKELDLLDELKITESDLLQAICSILSIKIEQWNEDEMATCSQCSGNFHESMVNMTDYDMDVCSHCLPHYKE